MKQKIQLAIILLLSSTSFAKEVYILEGQIDNAPSKMYLQIDDTNLKATYFTNNSKLTNTAKGFIQNEKITFSNDQSNTFEGVFSFKQGFEAGISNTTSFLLFPRILPFPSLKISAYTNSNQYSVDNGSNTMTFEYYAENLQFSNPYNLEGISNINQLFQNDYIKKINESQKELKLWKIGIDDLTNVGIICISCNYVFWEKYELVYSDLKIISLLQYLYTFSGGAHGLTSITPVIFRLIDGSVLSEKLNEFIIDTEEPKLIELLRAKLLQQKTKDTYFDFDTIRLNENYSITPKGIEFIYIQYEIASYADGIIKVLFSFEELKPFIKKSSPLWYLF